MGKKKTRDALTYETLPELFTGICDAIREKTGGSDSIAHQSIPSEISNLPIGGDTEIAFNDQISVTAYQATSKSYTVVNGGTLRLMVHCSTENRFLSATKNNNALTPTTAFQASNGQNAFQLYNNVSVVAGDVINVVLASQGLSNPLYIMGIITPTT